MTGVDFPASLSYIGSGREAVLGHPELDYDALVRPVEARMMRSIWRIVRERQAAEDALQDALTVIWKKRNTVARHPNPQALILRIAVTQALDALRKSRRRLRSEVSGLTDNLADDSAGEESKNSEGRELRTAVLAAVGRLPKRQAEAVLLRIIEDQSYEAIALAMGCSESTARIHVMRGKAALARRLADYRPGRGPGFEKDGKEKAS